MGRATGVADTLCSLELDLARYKNWIARPAANFLRGYPLSRCDHGPFCCIRRASSVVTAARLGLPAFGLYWGSDVCVKLWPPFLGRTARFVRLGSGIASDHSDVRYALRASNASRRTTAAAQTFGRTTRGRRRSTDLRASSRFQRIDGFLGRTWHHSGIC